MKICHRPRPRRVTGRRRFAILAALLGMIGIGRPVEAGGPTSRPAVEEAVKRGLRLVEEAAGRYPTHRTCFSCHHQTLPMQAMVTAREHGVAIDEELLQAQADFSHDSFRERAEPMRRGKGIGGGSMTVAYGLRALELAGRPPDDVTEAMVSFLLENQRADGSWPTGGNRPPLEESLVTCTVLATRGLQKFAAPDRREASEAAIARARAWLDVAGMKRQEDRNSRLWGLHLLGADDDRIARAREDVLAAQHDDGGWSPRDDMPSDAYATGQALWSLHEAGLAADHPSYARGVRFLLETRCDDGSWKVETRAKPVQVYFDNGDPHG
jgi:N-acyl-D-amino-acid deacylase